MNTKNFNIDQNGNVTGKAKGQATITVKTNNGKKATATVTVNEKTVGVDSITLNKTSDNVLVGAVIQLTATVKPSNASDKSVKWSSSNPTVATVSSNGLVTAKQAGSATITATASNGKKATFSLTVNQATGVTGVQVSPSSSSVVVGYSIRLTARVLPSNATDTSVRWSSSNPNVATVDQNGKVVGKSPGEAIIYATAYNGVKGQCVVTVR